MTDSQRKWYLANREREIARAKAWRAANPDRRRENNRRWRTANPEKSRAMVKKWRAANPEKAKAADRRKIDAKPEQYREAWRKYRADHREECRAHSRAWRLANPEKASAWKRANPERNAEMQARRHARQMSAPRIEKIDRAEIYARDGGLCAICGKHVPRASFTLDHITPLSKGGSHTYDNLTVAHGACNSSKGNRNTPTQRPLFSRLR